MVNTIVRTFTTTKRSFKQRLIELSLENVDREVYKYIEKNPGLRLYQIDSGTLNSHHNWGAKFIVERLSAQRKVIITERRVGKQLIKRYWVN